MKLGSENKCLRKRLLTLLFMGSIACSSLVSHAAEIPDGKNGSGTVFSEIVENAGDDEMKALGESIRAGGVAQVVTPVPEVTGGTTYYVSPNGDDSYDGISTDTPWKSVEKVNATTFGPGDMVLFEAGGKWELVEPLHPKGSGEKGSPLIIGAFGEGAKPCFDAKKVGDDPNRSWMYGETEKHSADGLYLEDQQYIEIRDLEITNLPDEYTGGDSMEQKLLRDDRRGVHIVGTVSSEKKVLEGIYVHDMYIHHVMGDAISATRWDASKRSGGIVLEIILKDEATGLPIIKDALGYETDLAGYEPCYFQDVLIEKNILMDNSFSSIAVKQLKKWGFRPNNDGSKAPQYYHTEEQGWYPHRDITIQNNYLDHDQYELGANTIYLTNSKESVVQYNYSVGAGTSAIELNQTDDIAVQWNEIYRARKKATGTDSNAIDPDRSSTNALIQYNYIHSCGDGILLCGFNYGSSVVRYNVIKDSDSEKRYLNVHGSKGHNYIYNNLFYNSTAKAATFIASSGGNGYIEDSDNHHYIFNNVFYSPNAAARIDDGRALEYTHNSYVGVKTVPAEDRNAVLGAPDFADIGALSGGSGNRVDISGLVLCSSSPLINAGKEIEKDESGNHAYTIIPVETDAGLQDFNGTAVDTEGPVDIGVMEYAGTDSALGGINGVTYDPYGLVKAGANVTITVGGQETKAVSDEYGFYSVYGLPAGETASVKVSMEGYRDSEAVDIIVPSADISRQDMALGASTLATGTISGRITNTGGATVKVFGAGGEEASSVTADANGAYLIEDVPTGSGYKLIFSKEGYHDAVVENVEVKAAFVTMVEDLRMTALPGDLAFILQENFDYETGVFQGNDIWNINSADGIFEIVEDEDGSKALRIAQTGESGMGGVRIWNKNALNATGQFTIQARIKRTLSGDASKSRFAIFSTENIAADTGGVSKPMVNFGFYPKQLFIDDGGQKSPTVKYSCAYDTWYEIRMDVDMDTDTFDYYLDGVLVRAGNGLRTAGEALNYFSIFGTSGTTGDILVDYLWVHKGAPDNSTVELGEIQIAEIPEAMFALDADTNRYVCDTVVPFDCEQVTVGVKTVNPLGKVTVNGVDLGYADDGEFVRVPLVAGENEIPIVVKAADLDGTSESQAYTLRLNRVDGRLLAYLTSLELSDVTVSPEFTGTKPDNDAVVYDGGTTKTAEHILTYTTVTDGCGSSVALNGTPIMADETGAYQITLAKGENNIQIEVGSATGDEFQGYTIRIIYAPEAEVGNGYTVSLEGSQTVAVGGEAAVSLSVASADKESFNAVDAELAYDEALFEFAGISDAENYKADVSVAGKVRVYGYGADKPVGKAVSVMFRAVGKTEGSDIRLISAKVDESANAVTQDAPDAAIGVSAARIIVSGYSVVLDNYLSGEAVAIPGEDYTFRPEDAGHYDYTIQVNVGGQDVTAQIIKNSDGSFAIPADMVTGDIVVKVISRTAKRYMVAFEGDGKEDAVGETEAVYGTDYSFTLNKEDGYVYTVKMTIADREYTGFGAQEAVYTVPGADITGNMVVTVMKTQVSHGKISVTFSGTGAGDAVGETSAEYGKAYSFAINRTLGYTYDVSAVCGEKEIAVVKQEDGSYVIAAEDMTDDVTITIVRQLQLTAEVYEYVKLDGQSIFLVLARGELTDGSAYSYDGNIMYWSEQYGAYAYLVMQTKGFDAEAALEKMAVTAGSAMFITSDGDVNETGCTDINDAQLVYDMYNARYADFGTVSMMKFLNADMNGDYMLNVQDAAAVVAAMLEG